MPAKSKSAPATLVDGLKAVSAALDDIEVASNKLLAREKKVQTLVAELTQIAASTAGMSARLLKIQLAMQRENLVFSSVSNVLKTRHDTAKNSIGNIR